MIILYLAAIKALFFASVQAQCTITSASIRLDSSSTRLTNRNNLDLVIEGNTTGAQAIPVIWRRNGTQVDRNTMINGGHFFDGGGESIIATGPCASRKYRVALAVTGYLPGEYTYTVNSDTPTPVMSPIFRIQDPGPPINIVLLQRSPGRVEISWTPPSGFPDAKYHVYFNNTDINTVGTEVTGTMYRFDYSPGSYFSVRIRASMGTYLSVPAASNSSSIIDLQQEIIITASPVTNISVSLTFSLPGQTHPDMYTVMLTSTTCTGIPTRTVSTTTNSITINNLVSGVDYLVNVSAIYTVAQVELSQSTTVTTNEAGPSGSPGVPVPIIANVTSITLMWTEIQCVQRNGVTTSYIIYYSEGTARNRTINTHSDATSYTVTGLSAFKNYTFAVSGVNQVNSGPFSAATELIRTAEDRPSEIRNLELNIGLFSIILTWEEPEIIHGILRHYIICYAVNGTTQNPQTVTYNSFSISNLYPNTEVSDISVSATTGGGRGPSVMADNIATLDEPDMVQNISIEILTTTSVRVSWNNTELHDITEFIIYSLLQDNNESNQTDMRVFPAPTSSAVIHSLTIGKEYVFEVLARANVGGVSVSGESAYSDPILVEIGSSSTSWISLDIIIVGAVSAVATCIIYSVLLVVIVGIVKCCKKANKINSKDVEISSVQISGIQMKSCSDMEKETEEEKVSQNKYDMNPEVILC